MIRCRPFLAVRALERATSQLSLSAVSAVSVRLSTHLQSQSPSPFIRYSCCFSTSTNAQEKIELPSNLVIDPRSSFAPQKRQPQPRAALPPIVEKEEDDDDNNNDDNKRSQSQQEEEYDDEEYDDEDYDEDEDDSELLYWSQQEVIYTKPLPERLNVEVHTLFSPESSSLTGTLILEESIFGLDPIRIDLLKRAVDYYRAKKRGRRKAKTKTIGEVSGSGKKVRPQKGGGVARAGHSRPPHWRGGAKAHGPKNITDYSNTKLNKKVRQLATRHVLSQKLKEGNLLLLNQMYELPSHKTNDLARLLEPWGMAGPKGASALLLDHYYPADNDDVDQLASCHAGIPTNLHVAAGNLQSLTVGNSHACNVYDILKHEKLVLTVSALQQIEDRLRD